MAERSERHRAVHAALATLPPEQRAALVLVDMQGMPVEEAAHVLGVAAGTVKSRCSRGRRRLATLLGAGSGGAGSAGEGNRDGPSRVPSMTDETPAGGDPR